MARQADVVAGAPILASWGNTLRDRSIVPFTSAAERTSQWLTPAEGAMSYLADVDTVYVYTGSAWVPVAATGSLSYVPTLTQSSAISKTVDYAKYQRFGPMVWVQVGLSITSSGTAGQPILCTLPTTATATANAFYGSGMMRNVAGGNYPFLVQFQSSTTVAFIRTDSLPVSALGTDPNFALAAAQSLQFFAIYETT